MENQIAFDVAANLIACKKDYYNCLCRSGYMLPTYKSSIVTEAYLKGIRSGTVWCIKDNKWNPKNCVKPPKK
jgi:hypothetical protein